MKKQILFLAMFTMALIFAGTNKSYSQQLTATPTCPTFNPVDCQATADTPLAPLAGKTYTYEVVVPTSSTALEYNWIVTTDKSFIGDDGSGNIALIAAVEANDGSGAHILAAGTAVASYNNTGGNGAATIPISWKSFTPDLANPVFLVVYVTDQGVCLTDNIEVWIIEPVNPFTLDIANVDVDGGAQGANYPTCVSLIQSAVWNPLTSVVDVDYGTNYLYFAVTAANWADAWRPSVEITAALGARVLAADWALASEADDDTKYNSLNLGAAVAGVYSGTSTANVLIQDVDGDGDNFANSGECIIIRLEVDHLTEETIIDVPVQLAVDGVTMLQGATAGVFDVVGVGDVHYTGGAGVCGIEDGFANDIANQTITHRPDVNEVNPAPASFVPKVGY